MLKFKNIYNIYVNYYLSNFFNPLTTTVVSDLTETRYIPLKFITAVYKRLY